MKIEDAIKGLITRPAPYASGLTLDDLRATDWTVVPAVVTPPPPPPTTTESANGASMTRGSGSIVDVKGVTWTLGTDGALYQNAVKMAGTGNITLAVYWNHQVYQQATGYGWFYWNGTVWVKTTDPRPAAPPTPTPTPIPTPAPAANRLLGVNIAGGEFNPADTRGMYTAYVYPTTAQFDYWAAKGLKTIRLPFIASRFTQPGDVAVIDNLIAYAASKGITIVLDLHQYGGMPEPSYIGMDTGAAETAFIKFWQDCATRFKGKTNVVFGLMNEPNRQTPTQWFASARKAFDAILAIDPTRVITVPGTAWTGAADWINRGNDVAALAAGFPKGTIFEVHQYLDSDSSGTHDAVVTGKGATALVAFTTWARANGMKGFLGEFGAGQSAASVKELGDMCAYMKANSDVWIGGTAWAAGAWWAGYFQSLEPAAGVDKPQVAALLQMI